MPSGHLTYTLRMLGVTLQITVYPKTSDSRCRCMLRKSPSWLIVYSIVKGSNLKCGTTSKPDSHSNESSLSPVPSSSHLNAFRPSPTYMTKPFWWYKTGQSQTAFFTMTIGLSWCAALRLFIFATRQPLLYHPLKSDPPTVEAVRDEIFDQAYVFPIKEFH